MARQRVLEIEQALIARTAQQHDVFGVVIAQHRHALALPGQQRRQHLFPRRGPAARSTCSPRAGQNQSVNSLVSRKYSAMP
jgi:hypothetical protein